MNTCFSVVPFTRSLFFIFCMVGCSTLSVFPAYYPPLSDGNNNALAAAPLPLQQVPQLQEGDAITKIALNVGSFLHQESPSLTEFKELLENQKGNTPAYQTLIKLHQEKVLEQALKSQIRGDEVQELAALIKKGINIEQTDEKGFNLLHHAASQGKIIILTYLIPLFAQAGLLNVPTKDDEATALILAARYDDAACIKALIDMGANIKLTTRDGRSALHEALQGGKMIAAQELVPYFKQGQLLNEQDSEGHTALIEAAYWGNDTIVKMLIEAGADIKKVTADNCSALHKAACLGSPLVLEALIPHFTRANLLNALSNRQKTALSLAAENGHVDYLTMLLEAGADIKAGVSALHFAAENGRLSTLRLLIPYFSKANFLNPLNASKETPLMLAVLFDNQACVKELVDAGADISHKNIYGQNALHSAIRFNKSALISYLLPRFAHAGLLDAQDNQGYTALMWAAHKGHQNVAQALVEAGADITKVDLDRSNALKIANHYKKNAVVEYLSKVHEQMAFNIGPALPPQLHFQPQSAAAAPLPQVEEKKEAKNTDVKTDVEAAASQQ